MGKRIIQQARGKGGPTYRAPGFRYKGCAKLKALPEGKEKNPVEGRIIDIVKCPGHSAPLIEVKYEDGESCLMIAPEGVKVGETVKINGNELNPGNTLTLKDIPEGTLIYNIEGNPGDGGKFCRSSGTFAKLLAKTETTATVELPSKKQKTFKLACRANLGVIAGGGRTEKPFVKAGTKYYAMKAKNKLWPRVNGVSMNAVDHPHGGTESAHKSGSDSVSRNAPPGAKVGAIAPRRTGRRKR